MAISGKPQKSAPAPEPAKAVSEQEVFDLIKKGGSVAKPTETKTVATGLKPMLVQLRLYPELVEEIDAVRKALGGKRHRTLSRHAWILSAIEEKLDRDKPAS